jgi:hypothetical protein
MSTTNYAAGLARPTNATQRLGAILTDTRRPTISDTTRMPGMGAPPLAVASCLPASGRAAADRARGGRAARARLQLRRAVAETPKRCAQLRQAPDQQPGDDPLLLEQVQSSERSAAAPVECPRARNATLRWADAPGCGWASRRRPSSDEVALCARPPPDCSKPRKGLGASIPFENGHSLSQEP